MKRLSVALMVAAAFTLVTTTAAQAVPAPKATGSIILANPVQALDFAVFETNPVKGSLTYTNYDLVQPGTGVWVPEGTFDVSFEVDPGGICNGGCVHRLTVTGFTPTSPTSGTFEGTGFYVPDPAWTETFTGTVHGSNISLTLVPDDGGLKYGWTSGSLLGTIDAAGAVTGTWSDNYMGLRTGTFSLADIGYEVYSYSASPTCVEVNDEGTKARFGYVIPAGLPYGGTFIVMKVIDNGSPGAGNDVFKFGVGTPGTCTAASYTEYAMTAGNLNVFA